MKKKPMLKKDLILEVAQLQERVKELETAKADDNLGDVLPTSEQALRESEDRWRTLAESSPDHILILTPDLIIEYANFASPGLTIDDILGKPICAFVEEDKRNEIKAILMGVINTKEPALYETEYPTSDGGMIYYETHATPRISDNQAIGLTLSSHDITARKRSEQEVQNAALKWEITFDSVTDALMVLDNDQRIVRTNRAMTEMFPEYTDPMIGKYCFEIIHGTQDPIDDCPILRLQSSLKRESMELIVDDRVLEIIVDPILDDSGNMTGAVHSIRDITKRKQAEQEFEDIFNLSPDMVGVFTSEGKLLKVNPAWEKILGYKQKELLDMGWAGLVHPDDVERTNKTVEKQLEGSSIVSFVNRYKCKDGSYKVLEWQATFAKEGIVHATARDVTEHRKRELELRESESLWRSLTENSPDHILTLAPDLTIQFANFASPGLTIEEIVGKPICAFVEEDKRNEIKAILMGVINTKEPALYETEYPTSDGGMIYYETHATPRISDNQAIGLTLSSRDITARKRSEQEVQNAALQWEITFDSVTDALMVLDNDQRIVRTNRAMTEMFPEYTDPMIGKYCFEIIHGTQDPIDDCPILRLQSSLKRESMELIVDDRVLEIIVDPILDDSGNMTGAVHSIRDITKRKEAEDKLSKNQYYLAKAQEIGKIGTWELDILQNVLTWTVENYKIFGVPPGTEMNYELFLNCIHPDDREYVNEKWSAALNNEPYDIEHRIIVNDKVTWVREKAEIDFDPEGQPVLAIGFTQDITERKLAEDKLIESETYIKTVMDNLPIGLAVNSVDPAVEFNYMNDNFAKYYRTTRKALEPQDSFWDAVYEDPVYREQIREKVLDDIASGNPAQMFWPDIPITRKGEDTTFVSARNTPLPDSPLMISTVWNVSERKEAEQEKDSLLEQLQAANERLTALSRALINSQEEERKRISQELHDELGQALTAITLDLKIIERDLDPDTPQDIKKRLSETRSIADELDQKIGELALDLRPSLLDDLGLLPAVRWYMKRWSGRAEVKVEIKSSGKEKRLSPEIETAIYRITQEALTNVAKHAQANKVKLNLDQGRKKIIISIEDDGIGFDIDRIQDKTSPSQGLGLIGIRERISLVGGHFEVHSKPGEGTRIEIVIPL